MEILQPMTGHGSYKIRTHRSLDIPLAEKLELFRRGELPLLRETPVIHNLMPTATNHGLNIIAQRLAGVTTYDLVITQAKIGTGTNTPAVTDTNLQTPTLSGILVANQSFSGGVATISFFITDAELSNGTYTEFGVFAGSQLIGRSLISPSYTKASNEDTSIEYQFTFANA